MEVIRYSDKYKTAWDTFVRGSKNGTFLLHRDYMEYHADRFSDHSVLFFSKQKLVALLAANAAATEIHTHGGLTYGGIITDTSMKVSIMLEVFGAMRLYFKQQGFASLRYKTIPHIYHQAPAEEDLYALFRYGATLYRRDVASVLVPEKQLPPYNTLRPRRLKYARKHNLAIQQSINFAPFMQIEQELLQTKYGTQPVHSASEITQLATLFPDNIKLYTASAGKELVAGIIIYESAMVAHCQYIGATAQGRKLAAVDALVDYLLTDVYAHKPYFDFGISTEQQGTYLNEGLVQNKESFGARAMVHDFYILDL